MEDVVEFSCILDNSNVFAAILNCLQSNASVKGRNITCKFAINKDGLVISVTNSSKVTMARIQFESTVFQEYSCSSSLSFCISLNLLLECLKIHVAESVNTSLHYSTKDETLRMTFEELGILTMCDVYAITCEDSTSNGPSSHLDKDLYETFLETEVVVEIIVISARFKDAMYDLLENIVASTAASSILVSASDSITFSLCDVQGYCSSSIKFPSRSECFVSWKCNIRGCQINQFEWLYHVPAMLHCLKALTIAKESYLRFSRNGLFCVQHQIPISRQLVDAEDGVTTKEVYVDFLIAEKES